MTWELYFAYIATVLVFFAHPPGPGQLLFMSHSARLGVRRALPVIAGNHAANVIQMLLAGFGLAGVIATSAYLFAVIKWLGVAYLAWLGVAMIRGAGRATPAAHRRASLVRQRFITATANPFAVMFFAALFPQFLDSGAPLTPQIAVLGATYLVIDGIILLAMGASALRIFDALGRLSASTLQRLSGTLMLLAAGILAARGLDAGDDR